MGHLQQFYPFMSYYITFQTKKEDANGYYHV